MKARKDNTENQKNTKTISPIVDCFIDNTIQLLIFEREIHGP